MKRPIVLVLAALVLAGCQTPADVRQAHRWERDALEAYRADNQALGAAFVSDLRLAWETQVRLVEDYELRLSATEGKVDVGRVQELLAGARKKLAEIETRLETIRGKVAAADANYHVAIRLHDAVDDYLGRSGVSEEQQQRFLDEAAALAARINKKKEDE